MTNEELANYFRSTVHEAAPLDYFDRFVDLAIYLNETLNSGNLKDTLIDDLQNAMVHAYELRSTDGDRSTT